MKIQLRDYVRAGGESTRNPEVDRVDWGKRVVFLPDGRWVPFENVVIGEAAPAPHIDASPGRTLWTRPPTLVVTASCEKCGKPFPSAKALNGHRRHCK